MFKALKVTLFFKIYNFLLRLSLPLVLGRLWWRGFQNPAYRQRWRERLGIPASSPLPGGLWLHAVSLGEAIAATPFIQAFQKRFPNVPITFTTMTPTGSAHVQRVFGDTLFHSYVPYDIPECVQAFFRAVEPRLLILMETELWPNCLKVAQKRKVPVLIANARLSPRSKRGYQRLGSITQTLLELVEGVLAQSARDGEYFKELGLPAERLTVIGNIKFDITLPLDLPKEALAWRAAWGERRPVWIVASTHAGEEEVVLRVFKKIRLRFKEALLILVPRHPERFKEVGKFVEDQGYTVARRSASQPVGTETEVFLIDAMGELPLWYAASDVAFVGGSFAPIGGHNTLEPAALGVPVVVGPYIHNFVEITELLLSHHALKQAHSEAELLEIVLQWFSEPETRQVAGLQGKKALEQARGALDKMMEIAASYFSS